MHMQGFFQGGGGKGGHLLPLEKSEGLLDYMICTTKCKTRGVLDYMICTCKCKIRGVLHYEGCIELYDMYM